MQCHRAWASRGEKTPCRRVCDFAGDVKACFAEYAAQVKGFSKPMRHLQLLQELEAHGQKAERLIAEAKDVMYDATVQLERRVSSLRNILYEAYDAVNVRTLEKAVGNDAMKYLPSIDKDSGILDSYRRKIKELSGKVQ